MGLSIAQDLKASIREEDPQLVDLIEEKQNPPVVQEVKAIPPPAVEPSEIVDQPSQDMEIGGQVLFITEQREDVKQQIPDFQTIGPKTLKSDQIQSMVHPTEEAVEEPKEEQQ